MLNARTRLPGLDLVRSTAILMVLWEHGIRFLPSNIFGKISPYPFIDGVDLFFVLSGWLVTGALYEKIHSGTFSAKQVFTFYASRWLRTLPAYWAVLCVNIVLLYYGITPGLLNHNAAFYFVFLQNFHQPLDLFFWESWSLSVEEWFYISFPFLLFLRLIVKRRPQAIFFTVCMVFIFLCFFVRLHIHLENPSLSADLYFRKLVICRLDMIAWGGLSYYMYRRNIFRFKSIWWCFIFFGLWIFSESISSNLYEKVFKFSLSGLSICLLMPYMSNLNVASRVLRRILEGISRISYALYLVHLGIVAGIMKFIWPTDTSWLLWGLYVVASTILACVLYKGIEKPFLRLREKWL